MKLISCYIEGYGKIKQREFSFDEKITSLLWENGEGKSTLASFLKAMLYGLKGYAKNSKEFCDREHFYPFDGGRFGGNLQIEVGGKVYKIERFFGEKSETGDSLTVYEDGKTLPAPPVDIGRVLLDMDEESFKRTAFLRHEDLEISSTSGIHARLNRFLEGSAEDGSLDEALAALEKAAKTYKKRGGGDKITEEKERIDALKAKIENASVIKGALEGKYARFSALDTRIKETQAAVRLAQGARERASQFEHYDSLIEELARGEAEVEALVKKYPHGVPTLEETRAFNAYLVASNELQIKIEQTALTLQEKEKLTALEARFEGGSPDEGTLQEIERKMEEAKSLRAMKPRTRTEQEQRLAEKFSRQKPSREELDEGEKRLAAYREKKKALGGTTAFAQVAEKAVSKKYTLFAVLAALLVLAGGGLLVAKLTLVGGLLAAVGGVALLLDGFLYLNKKSSGQTPIVNPQRRVLEEECNELERRLTALLLPYGYAGEEGVEVAFDRFKRDLMDLEALQMVERAENENFSQGTARARTLEEELSAFFTRYGAQGEGDFAKLSSLKVAISDFASLRARQTAAEQERAAAEQECASLLEKMNAYQEKYGLISVDPEELLEDARKLARAVDAVKTGKEKAAAFKREKGLEERAAESVGDLEELQTEAERLQEESSKLDREIRDDERVAELLEGYEAEKKQAEERLKAYKRKHLLLTETSKLLSGAAGKLRDKYVKPVKDEFLRYAEVIECALGEKVVMTKDFELRFERNGVERSEKHLSSGQRSVCALCFRLALLANMYEGEKPFLVLDDPFTALDELHLGRVREVLQALSKEVQMVYMTCHSSREI